MLCLCVIFLCISQAAYSQKYLVAKPLPGNIVVENVILIDRSGEVEDVKVSLRIRDHKLDLITQNALIAEESDLVLNANDGMVLGELNLGEAPSFMILSSDPREDFNVLLNTAAHTSFAMHDGKVVRNNLERIAAPEAGTKVEPGGWFAYAAPPVSLPVAYRNKHKWNRFDTDWIAGSLFGALVVDRQYWPRQDANSEAQVGDLKEFEAGEIRALRFGLVGSLKLPTPVLYSISASTNAFDKGIDVNQIDDFSWSDWRFDVPAFAGTTLSIGKQKEPISMERLMGLVHMPMQERTAAGDALLPARNTGLIWSGNAFQRDVSWAVSAFMPGLDPEADIGMSESPTSYVARLTGVPYESEDTSDLVHLGLGVRYTDAVAELRYASEPEFNQAPIFIDTDEFTANEVYTYNLEASWRRGPLWLMGEYLYQDIKAPALDAPGLSSYYIQAAYTLTGERREYNRRSGVFRPLQLARSVNQFGWGTWELAARFSSADFDDGEINGGELDIYSLGLNWWLTPAFSFSVNYRYSILDRFGVEGESSGVASRLVLMLN
ncbi:OprO/OprP family phosphate-selective porin [Candidatus Litorirhabdus singularis]|uniref:OprO/OprP family phosphate-selective porin n=1 Tax=Candidatus Litorirhabdus singularis TaxID=2518993 RepID=UPI00242AD75C|nr:porin [Candidatus Litorirhabdus singularis]